MNFRVNSLLAGKFGFRDGFARDCLLQRRVERTQRSLSSGGNVEGCCIRGRVVAALRSAHHVLVHRNLRSGPSQKASVKGAGPAPMADATYTAVMASSRPRRNSRLSLPHALW